MTRDSLPTARRGRAVVLGAGLAGLCAASELAKSGCFEEVVVLEKSSEVGGNVRSRPIRVRNSATAGKGETVRTHWVDFGALQVWEWYHSFLETAKEYGMEKLFVPLVRPPVLLESRGEDTKRHDCRFDRFSVSSVVGLSDLTRLAKMPDEAFDPYEHEAVAEEFDSIKSRDSFSRSRFDVALDPKKSLADVFPTKERSGGRLATYYESYTYGNTSEAPAYLWLPMAVRSGLEMSADGKTQFLPWKMQRVLRDDHDCRFVFGASVQRVDVRAKTVTFLRAGDGNFELGYDVLISATPFGAFEFANFPQLDAIARSNPVKVDVDSPEYRYTSYAAACVELNQVPRSDEWSACFAVPKEDSPLQIRSWVNLHRVAGIRNRVLVYVHAKTATDLKRVTPEAIFELIHGLCFFRDSEPMSIDHVELFPHTMPVFNAPFLNTLDRVQGFGGVWFAGHYLASFPSMELAVFTGKMAATRALESVGVCRVARSSEELRRIVAGKSLVLTQKFKRDVKRADIGATIAASAAAVAFFGALAAVLLSTVDKQETSRTRNNH